MKKRVGLFTVAVLSGMAVAAPSAMAAGGFSDVGEKLWFAQAVRNFTATGLISGYEDGTFRPDNTVNRSEFVQMLYNVMGKQAVETGVKAPFSDVEGKWYSAAVTFASKSRLLDEFPAEGTFNADQKLTRGEAARLIWNLIGQDDERKVQPDATRFPQHLKADAAGGKAFADAASFPEWAKLPIGQLAHFGVINGYSDGTFQAGKAITRAEATALLDGALRKVGYAAILNATVTQKKFIDAMYEVLGKASTIEGAEMHMEQWPFYSKPNGYYTRTTPNGGGYTAEKVGLQPEDPQGQVKAGVASQWLAKWARQARNVNLDTLQMDAYTWAQMGGWFDGTSVTEATDIIQPSDIEIMNRNLQRWLVGYRQEGNTVYLHFPMLQFDSMVAYLKLRPPGEAIHFQTFESIKSVIVNSIRKWNRTKVVFENGVASYYEEHSDTERVFARIGVHGNPDWQKRSNSNAFDDPNPIRIEIPAHSTYFMVTLAPQNYHFVGHGSICALTYAMYLDSSRNIKSISVAKVLNNDGTVILDAGDIIDNYTSLATGF